MMKGDEKVLSYGGVVLRRSDVELLEGPHYLNDQIIEFFFSYLTANFTDNSSRVLLVGPVITFLLLHCPDIQSLNDTITPLELHNREMVVFALNNNEDVDVAEGGSHWTLLVYSRHGNVFDHYDSLVETNGSEAENLMDVVKPFLGGEASQANLFQPTAPQQVNGYDCGVYVMAIAQVLCNSFQEKQRAVMSHDIADIIQSQVTPCSVHKLRSSTLDIISQLSRNSHSTKTCNSSD